MVVKSSEDGRTVFSYKDRFATRTLLTLQALTDKKGGLEHHRLLKGPDYISLPCSMAALVLASFSDARAHSTRN